MPKRRFRKKRGGRRKRRSKLADRKINTLVEKRIMAISRANDEKLLEKRCLRQFPDGVYAYGTNTFAGQAVDNTGRSSEVCQVVKPTLDSAAAQDLRGKRAGNQVNITGFQLLMKVYLPENNSQATIENCNLSYKLCGVKDEWYPPATSPYTPQLITLDDLLPWYPFGYMPMLDREQTNFYERRRVRTFLKGVVKSKSTEQHAQSVTIKRWFKFKNPLKVAYDKDDVVGTQKPEQWKFYLAFRSNVPAALGADMKPHIVTCLKTYYYEPL